MADRIFSKSHATEAYPVILKILGSNIPQEPDAVLSDLDDVVKAMFQITPSLLFCGFGYDLRCRFCRLPDALISKLKVVPPNLSSSD
ncbi:MAG TPA: hypothetical protein VIX90_06215 [Edaphobacter sp.]